MKNTVWFFNLPVSFSKISSPLSLHKVLFGRLTTFRSNQLHIPEDHDIKFQGQGKFKLGMSVQICNDFYRTYWTGTILRICACVDLYVMIWYDMLWYDMICYDMIWYVRIFIYCIWVSTRWQWSANLYNNRKEAAIYKRKNNTGSNTKTQNSQNRQKTYKQKQTI